LAARVMLVESGRTRSPAGAAEWVATKSILILLIVVMLWCIAPSTALRGGAFSLNAAVSCSRLCPIADRGTNKFPSCFIIGGMRGGRGGGQRNNAMAKECICRSTLEHIALVELRSKCGCENIVAIRIDYVPLGKETNWRISEVNFGSATSIQHPGDAVRSVSAKLSERYSMMINS
jgi:hypothetical protein